LKVRNLLLFAALGAVTLLLFAPSILGGRVLWSADIGRVYYPVASLLRETLRTGDPSRLLWCPELGAGLPLVADGVTTPFYPPHWPLLVLLHADQALTAALFVAYLASGLAMAAFVRTLGLGHAAAAVAGLVYAWSGFAVGHAAHVNVVAGLPFLPLMLLFLERAARAAPLRNVTLAGVGFGMQCLGRHPQVALMSGCLSLGYALFRLRPPRMSARDLAQSGGLMAVFVAIGVGISAIYYLPMAELARQSVRLEGGLSHARAVAYALPLPHLVTAVSPFFFFDASTGDYQGAWNPAEMALYAGLPTLVLAGIALGWRPRDPRVRFFAAVALVSLLLALGDATPLHGLLHSLPVFRGLRAPARYVLLVDTAFAVLAALGLDSLQREASATVPRRALLVLAVAAILAVSLPFAEPLWRGRLAGDGWRDTEWNRGDPGLLAAQAWLPLLWLTTTAAWLWRRPRSGASAWAAAGAMIVAADLSAFAAMSFAAHWVRPETVRQPDAAHALAASAGLGRTYVVSGPEPWRSASDLPVVQGVRSLNAYVSLPLARHALYTRAFWLSDQTARGLLDAAAVTTVVDSWRRPLDPRSTLAGVEFSPRHPLAGLGPGRQEREVRFRLGGMAADRIQLVTSLHEATEVRQGAEVARVTLEATEGSALTFSLRAGRETAERLHDGRVAHLKPEPHRDAWSLVDRRSEGSFYLARFVWPETRRMISLRIVYTARRGRLLLFGGRVGGSHLSPFMRGGYRPVREEKGAVLYENERARPRAFAVHRIVVVSAPSEAVRRLATGEVRPEEAAVLEDPAAPPATGVGPSVVSIQNDEPLSVDLTAKMKGDGYVVLADTTYPGWRATVDGASAPIFAANGLFRAVFVKDGSHRVRFEYRPRALHLGAAIAALTAALAVGLVLASRTGRAGGGERGSGQLGEREMGSPTGRR
jgi:hypothetical protein